jgi:glycosyltransferase involved in cell wall biosynthesis
MTLRAASHRPTVCIDCRYIRERPSGIATIVQSLVDFIPGWAPDLDFVLLKHPKAPERLCAEPNVREVVVSQEANGPATLFVLPKLVDLSQVDLFHCPYNILPHGLRMPTVVTVCDVMWLKTPHWARSAGWWGYVEQAFYQHGTWRSIHHATRIIAISQATRSEIASLDPDAASRTRVVLEGVSEDFRMLQGQDRAERLKDVRERCVPGAQRYILTVGQYVGYKNHETVVRAFALAFWDDPGVHLVLVQRLGNGKRVLTDLARSLGVEDRVHFLHTVAFEDLVALLNGAIALCHPSLVEGFGNLPSEAMSSGCPVVTSNRSSMPEVSGVAALLVDPEDPADVAHALRRVAYESGLAESMRERGLARAKQLTWQACARGTLDVYREVLSD